MLSDAVRFPVTGGVKIKPTVVFCPAPIVSGRTGVPAMAKSAAFAPVIVSFVTMRSAVPGLLMVRISGLLDCPITWLWKSIGLGDALMDGTVPTPFKEIA